MSTRGFSDGLHGNGGDGTHTEEGLGPLDMQTPEELASSGTFRGGERYGGTERGRLVAEMKLEREQRRQSRAGSPNRLARYDMGASAKVYGLRALATIVEIMEDELESASVRLMAAKEVLDRGFGRPKQVTEVGGIDGDEIRNRLIIEFVGVPARSGAEIAPLGNSGVARAGTRMPESEVNNKWMEGVGSEVVKEVGVGRGGSDLSSWHKEVARREVEDVEPVVSPSERGDRQSEARPSFVNPWAKE